MARKTSIHELKNNQLIALFDELIAKRPDLLKEIPQNAALIMQVMGDSKFNIWAKKIAEANSPDQPKLLVQFTLKTPSKNKSVAKLDSFDQVAAMEFQVL